MTSCRTHRHQSAKSLSLRIIARFHSEGFECEVIEHDDGRVEFTADADIDADGANGQRGQQAAYTIRNDGSEHLANGGMGLRNGKVVFTQSWGPDIAVRDSNGNPLVTTDGIVVTKTAYRHRQFLPQDPEAWVDAETVPYIVVPPAIRKGVKGIVLGCRARATHTKSNRSVVCVVADIGPRKKVGELSIAAARAIGVPSSPRTGGEDRPIIKYELWPGDAAIVNGEQFELQPV